MTGFSTVGSSPVGTNDINTLTGSYYAPVVGTISVEGLTLSATTNAVRTTAVVLETMTQNSNPNAAIRTLIVETLVSTVNTANVNVYGTFIETMVSSNSAARRRANTFIN